MLSKWNEAIYFFCMTFHARESILGSSMDIWFSKETSYFNDYEKWWWPNLFFFVQFQTFENTSPSDWLSLQSLKRKGRVADIKNLATHFFHKNKKEESARNNSAMFLILLSSPWRHRRHQHHNIQSPLKWSTGLTKLVRNLLVEKYLMLPTLSRHE